MTVRDVEFSHVAFLPNEVINHIQDHDQAKALLGLVLCHVAPKDEMWSQVTWVTGWRARQRVDVPLRRALWVGDLRSRAWIPVRGEDDKATKVAADATTLRGLVEPSWLEDNDEAIAVLTECFGFDELELRLLGIAPEVQSRVRQGLSRLLEAGGGDPEFYESLAMEVEGRERRRRDMERSRRMGLAVQEAVRRALESQGLNVTLVDRGFDYEVESPGPSHVLEEAAVRFELGPYFVEVKATTSGPVQLTPTQAQTAAASEAGRYVLCVVDLRGLPQERLDEGWTAAQVHPLVSMVSDIGRRISDTCVLVGRARVIPEGTGPCQVRGRGFGVSS